jgi:hypothetical protein
MIAGLTLLIIVLAPPALVIIPVWLASTTEFIMRDEETGSVWDFTGKAAGGELAGKQLVKIPVLKDYWFDWKSYNPDTRIYIPGNR